MSFYCVLGGLNLVEVNFHLEASPAAHNSVPRTRSNAEMRQQAGKKESKFNNDTHFDWIDSDF